jgi:signal transduction histidine kinase
MPFSSPILRETVHEQRALRRYGVAIALAVFAWITREMLRDYGWVGEEAPFVLFLSAVMAAGWFGGFWPGMVTAILCALIVDVRFQIPLGSLAMTHDQAVRIFFFMLEATVTSALCGRLHNARYRAELNAAEARELEKTVEQISEAEQRRIGQDLHDGLGQHLTGVAFLSKALQQKLSADGRAEANDAATINQLVNESIRWTRDLARGLAPMDLDRTSLTESLKDLARKTSLMFSVECIYEGAESVQLTTDEAALNLYRVAQEAVSNAVKHGKARHVTIDLVSRGGLTLTIQDDGVGFDAAKVMSGPRTSGMGLLVMKYRAGVIGGKLQILPASEGGTLVMCQLPPDKLRPNQIINSVWASEPLAHPVTTPVLKPTVNQETSL